MESNKNLKSLSDALNEEVNVQSKHKSYMRTLLLSNSKNFISKTKSYEWLNLISGFVCSLYFISRTYYYQQDAFLFWTGIVASILWIIQFIYSSLLIKKLGLLHIGQDNIVVSLSKIESLISEYIFQKKLYIVFSPLTIFSSIPIPLYEFRGIHLFAFLDQAYIYYPIILFVVACAFTVWLSNYMWDEKMIGPLENAKQNLEELKE